MFICCFFYDHHNQKNSMRPAHIHITVEAPGYRKLTTALYPEGNVYLRSDCVFGVKESLVVVRIFLLLTVKTLVY